MPHCERISLVIVWPRVEPVTSKVIIQFFEGVKMFFSM